MALIFAQDRTPIGISIRRGVHSNGPRNRDFPEIGQGIIIGIYIGSSCNRAVRGSLHRGTVNQHASVYPAGQPIT